jgi:penicillin-binding protein 1A
VRKPFLFLVVLLLGGMGLAASSLALVPAVRDIAGAGDSEPPDVNLEPLAQRSLVYDVNGQVIATLRAEENREPLDLDQIPEPVVQTILAVEDEDFYEHNGFNLRSTIRALFENVSAGGVEQGGSTITQQLVKNSLLTPERNLDRKVQEAILAVELEHQYSKDEILQRYLNEVYFGGGAYGIQAAAETYWGLDASELTWGHAALLASLIQNPVGYDPVRQPELAIERRQVALDLLVDQGLITQAEADVYGAEPLPTARQQVLPLPNQYFVRTVVEELLDDERLGTTEAERYNSVFRGGLEIHTTFNSSAQFFAQAARDSVMPDTGGQFTAAIASVEPSTGAVRAMVGGPGFDQYQYNLATQGLRQPGSSFKIFVLVAALEAGAVPSDTVDGGGPCSFANPGGAPDPYVANNFGGSRGGTGTIESLTLSSSNCGYLRLGQFIGLQRVTDTARAMGITTPLNPNALSMPIGAFEVHPMEMAGAAAVIANGGVRNEPYYIEQVLDRNGDELWAHEANPQQVISEQTACLAGQILRANVQSGTGTAAQLPGGREAGGKTGTAQSFGDAWFVGFTRQLATAVWMGNAEARVPMTNVGGRQVTGGSYPAEMWGRYNEAYHTLAPNEALCQAPFPTRPGRKLDGAIPNFGAAPPADTGGSDAGTDYGAACPSGQLPYVGADGEIAGCTVVEDSPPVTPPPTALPPSTFPPTTAPPTTAPPTTVAP